MAASHRSLGDDVTEKAFINEGIVPLLLEVQPKQHSHLLLIRLVLGVHLREKVRNLGLVFPLTEHFIRNTFVKAPLL